MMNGSMALARLLIGAALAAQLVLACGGATAGEGTEGGGGDLTSGGREGGAAPVSEPHGGAGEVGGRGGASGDPSGMPGGTGSFPGTGVGSFPGGGTGSFPSTGVGSFPGDGGSGGQGVGGSGGSGGDPDLLDDFEANNTSIAPLSGRSGHWYSFADGTGGGMTPAEGAQVRPSDLNALARDGSLHALHVVCVEAFTSGGAGVGFHIADGDEYGVAFYAGVRFFVRSGEDFTDVHPEVVLQVKTVDTATAADGGTCPPAGQVEDVCNNVHRASFAVTATWTEVSVPFTRLAQDDSGGHLVDFDPDAVLAIQFAGPAEETFDFWIDDVSLYAE